MLSLVQLSYIVHRSSFQHFSQPISNPKKACGHRHESAGIATLRIYRDKFPQFFQLQRKFSGEWFSNCSCRKTAFFSNYFHYSFRNTDFGNCFCNTFGAKGNNPYLAQIITLERTKLGPDNNLYIYIHICIYIYIYSIYISIYRFLLII